MHDRHCLFVAAAMVALLTSPASTSAQQFGTLHTVTGHSFRPEPRPASEELIKTLTVPEGFLLEVFASDLGNVRMMAMATDGTLYVTRPGSNDVIALADRNGDGRADGAPRVVASDLTQVHGIALRDGRIYLATVHET